MTTTATRCPRCGALTSRSLAWCSLCFLDLRPPAGPELDPQPLPPADALPADASNDPTGADLATGGHAHTGAGSDGQDADPDGDAAHAGVDVDMLLAELAACSSATAGAGRLAALLADPWRRALLITGATVGLLVFVLLVLSVLGLLLG